MQPCINICVGVMALVRGRTWRPEQLARFRDERLKALVRHAYERVPFYRRLFDNAGVKPRHIRGVRDLGRLPCVTRKDIQSLPLEEILARGVASDKLVTHRTSGSSGAPLTIRRTKAEELLLAAFRLRAMFAMGLRMTDRRGGVSYCPWEPCGERKWPLHMRMGLLPTHPVHCLSEPGRIIARLKEIDPDVVVGYAESLARVAPLLTDTDRLQLHPRFVATGAEVLSPEMRRRIREGFRAPVYDFYGSHEFNLLAWECPVTGSYHVCDDTLILEVLRGGRPAEPGEEGEVVGTALHSYAMPFIRYRLTDLVVRGSGRCSCGSAFSTISGIQGRLMDRFLLPDGRRIHPYTIVDPLIAKVPWVSQYRLIQRQLDRIEITLVPEHQPAAGELARVRELISGELGRAVELDISLTDELPLGPAGKFRPYECLIRETASAHTPQPSRR